MLVKQKQIPFKQVSGLLGTHIIWGWEKYETIFTELRAKSTLREHPQLSDWLEYLYNEMAKVKPQSILSK